jgi:hypothetical protein
MSSVPRLMRSARRVSASGVVLSMKVGEPTSWPLNEGDTMSVAMTPMW